MIGFETTLATGAAIGVLMTALPALAQVPAAQLATPPAGARHFIIESTGGKHGDSWMWTAADGTRMGRESMNLRGQVWETDTSGKAGADGLPAAITVRGVSPQGDAAESFAVEAGKAVWKSQIDAGDVAYGAPAFYATMGGPASLTAWLIEALIASPDKSLAMLPGGRATAKVLTTAEVGSGASKKTVTAWAVSGLSTSPVPVWTDADGKFFGLAFGLGWLPEGDEGELAKLEATQAKAIAAQAPALVKALLKTPAGPVAFTHVRLFDADAGIFRPDQTVIVDKGLIVKVGPAAKVAPGKAMVIDGTGKTLVPGLWDAHRHMGADFDFLSNLANGITSFRSPGDMIDRAVSVRARRQSGELLVGEGWAQAIVDKKDPLAAQGSETVSSAAETIAAVRKIKAAGLWGVKFDTSMDPAWIAPAAAEAHRLGLHVSGHVPARMRPLEAVRAGYDELTHINFVVMQLMPQSVVDKANTAARIEGPAKYARGLDLAAPEAQAMLAELKRSGTVVDPTLVVFEHALTKDGGAPDAAYAPYARVVPATLARGFNAGGHPLIENLTRDDYRASFAKLLELTGRLHRAGVPIVAGTDGEGLELVRELELYQKAGMSAAAAIQTATMNVARLVGADKRTGSIAVGKEADMILVDGDPSRELGALRRIDQVVMDGTLMSGEALRTAAGYSGRPL